MQLKGKTGTEQVPCQLEKGHGGGRLRTFGGTGEGRGLSTAEKIDPVTQVGGLWGCVGGEGPFVLKRTSFNAARKHGDQTK